MAFDGIAEAEDGFDVGVFDGVEIAANGLDSMPDDTAAEGEMEGSNFIDGGLQAEWSGGEDVGVKRVDFARPIVFFGLSERGGLGEEEFEVAIVGFGEGREGFETQAVASEGGVKIGGVFAPFDVLRGGKSADFGAGAMEQRADEMRLGRDGAHGGEASEAAATEKAEENGFGLI